MINVPASIEKVPCQSCGYVGAIKWNKFNKVVQCHNCGQVVECVGFNVLIEGIVLVSDKFHEELSRFHSALVKFIEEYPAGVSLLPSRSTFTEIENPFEDKE